MNVVSAVTAGLIVGKAGRKQFWLLVHFYVWVLAFLVYKDNTDLSRWFVLFYVFSFGMSLGPIVWMYMAEVLPDVGMAVATFINWIFTLIIGLTFPIVKEPTVLNSYGVFMLFSGWCLAGLVLIVTSVKETQGKSQAELLKLYYDGNYNDNETPIIKTYWNYYS